MLKYLLIIWFKKQEDEVLQRTRKRIVNLKNTGVQIQSETQEA